MLKIDRLHLSPWRLPNLKKVQKPSTHRVYCLSIRILQVAAVAGLTYALPIVSVGFGIVSLGFYTVVHRINQREITQKLNTGIDFETCRLLLKSVKQTQEIRKTRLLFSLARTGALVALFQFQFPVLLVLSTILIFDWTSSGKKQEELQKKIQMCWEAFQNHEELEKIKQLFPNLPSQELYEKCRLEKELRTTSEQHMHQQKEWVSLAWQRMITHHTYTIEQGLEGDVDIFEPLCRMAVITELEHNSGPDGIKLPPTLELRTKRIQELRQKFGKLSTQQREILVTELLTNKKESSSELAQKINEVAIPMLQTPELFADPLIKGAERYSLKQFKLPSYITLQKEKLKRYKRDLFLEKTISQ